MAEQQFNKLNIYYLVNMIIATNQICRPLESWDLLLPDQGKSSH